MDKILELRQKQAAAVGKMRALVKTAETEKRSLTTEEQTTFDATKREIEGIKTDIANEEQLRAMENEIPKPDEAQRGLEVIVDPQKDLEPGIRMARWAKANLLASKERSSVADVIKRMYPDDKVLRSAMSSGTSEAGGVFVPANLSQEVIPMLRQAGVIRALGARSISLPNGNLTIPKQTGAANFTWIGEAAAIAPSAPTTGKLNFAAKKLAGMIPIPNELLKDASINADAYVRDEMINGMSEAEDITLLYGAGGSYTPSGLATLCSARADDIGALISEDVVIDLMTKVLSAKLTNPKLGWMMPGVLWGQLYQLRDANGRAIFRDEMKDGLLMGCPFKINNNITVGVDANAKTQLWLGDFNQVLIGESGTIEIAVSTDASYVDGETTKSAFQNDMTLMRVLNREDFGVRYTEAFAFAKNIYTVTA